MKVLPASWLAIAASLAACGTDAPDLTDPEDGFVVDDDKADNFLSNKAREFTVTGKARVSVEAGASDAKVKKAIGLEHTAITWFLNQYLVDKEGGEHGDANFGYGGFAAMVKDGDYQDLDLKQLNATTYEFTFTQTIAGKKNLVSKLPLDAHGTFSVEIGKPTVEEMEKSKEWYRQDPWNDWNPANVAEAKKTTIDLTVMPVAVPSDGWWDYNRLFEDGVLTVDVHFGYDYNPEAAHIQDPKLLRSWLAQKGFKLSSGVYKRKLDANGRDVSVEVRLFSPVPGTATDPDTDAGGKRMEADMFASLASRDVIVYSGHSGSLYGFALANWDKTDEGDVDDTELATAELARGKYQIVFAEGCNTYMLGHTLLSNPSKMGKDIDVITTTSFSVSYSPVEDFLGRLLELDSQGRHRPRTMTQTLTDLDLYSVGEPSPTMYGIHGISDDPQIHPYANLDKLGASCTTNASCGGPGNACITMGSSGKRCTAACTADAGCGSGFRCKKVASAATSTIYGSYCAK